MGATPENVGQEIPTDDVIEAMIRGETVWHALPHSEDNLSEILSKMDSVMTVEFYVDSNRQNHCIQQE